MAVTLKVIEGPHQGSAFEFTEHDTFIVGRSAQAQFRLPLKDKSLSRSLHDRGLRVSRLSRFWGFGS